MHSFQRRFIENFDDSKRITLHQNRHSIDTKSFIAGGKTIYPITKSNSKFSPRDDKK